MISFLYFQASEQSKFPFPVKSGGINVGGKSEDVAAAHRSANHVCNADGHPMSTTSGNHSISLVIPGDKDPVTANNSTAKSLQQQQQQQQHHHLHNTTGLVKIGGRSAPSSPLPSRIVGSGNNASSSPTATTISIARQCATPPIPPRQNQHVSTTYLNQEKHTIHVTAPLGGGSGCAGPGGNVMGNGTGLAAATKDGRSRTRNDSLNPEITIDLVDTCNTVP